MNKLLICSIPDCENICTQDYDQLCDLHLDELEVEYKKHERDKYDADQLFLRLGLDVRDYDA